jgi:hypothetical protein
MDFALNELVNGSQLVSNVEGQPPAWIVPPAVDREPNPSFDYVVSFIRHHERGFTTDYATTTGWSCTTSPQRDFAGGHLRGVPRIPVNWDLWVHLFRTELHTLTTHETQVRHAVRAGSLSISLRDSRREFYIPCTMTSNNAKWERGWFYLCNDRPDLPPTPARC